jgi:Ca2+-dependent lipid-binding protein
MLVGWLIGYLFFIFNYLFFVLLHALAVYFSHHQVGILVHKESKKERGLCVQTMGVRLM